MADDFFKKADEPADEPEETQDDAGSEADAPEKITIGEEEYSQDELSELVGLGKMGRDLQKKHNTSFDKLMPEYTKATQKLSELEEKLSKQELDEIEQKAKTQGFQNLSPEEYEKQAKKELRDLGVPLQEDVQKMVADYIEANQLISETKGFISNQIDQGKPEVTERELLEHMARKEMDMDEAYQDMFQSQLKVWEETQVKKGKPEGMVTEDTSTAGASKKPEPTKITRDNLEEMVDKALSGEI